MSDEKTSTQQFHIKLQPVTNQSGTPLFCPLAKSGKSKKQDWLCAGNIPSPFSSIKAHEEFLAWAEPLIDELEGLDREVNEAQDRLWFLKEAEAGRIVEPPHPGRVDQWEAYRELLRPLAEHSKEAAFHLEYATRQIEDLISSGCEQPAADGGRRS